MKKNFWWGLIILLVGVFLILDRLNIYSFNLFFKGWWTLFIIVPSLIGLITERDKTGNLIAFVIGICLLLVMQDVISFEILWKLFFPIILVLIGISLIFKDSINKKIHKEIKELGKKNLKKHEYNAIFSGQDLKIQGETEEKLELSAIFGGLKLDLKDAKLPDKLLIEATSLFGGIELIVPSDVVVKTTSTNIFGGINNKCEGDASKKVIYVESVCVFGGLDINE